MTKVEFIFPFLINHLSLDSKEFKDISFVSIVNFLSRFYPQCFYVEIVVARQNNEFGKPK